MPNLASDVLGATITSDTSPSISDTYSVVAQNLISNIEHRSGIVKFGPIIDSSGSEASYKSCYRTDKTVNPDNTFTVGIDLGQTVLQHAIVIMADHTDK